MPTASEDGAFPLAQELVNKIVEELSPEAQAATGVLDAEVREALRACTLVNKPFRSAAQRFLFSSIAVYDTPSKLDSLLAALLIFPDLYPWNYVRSLSIHLSSPASNSQQLERAVDLLAMGRVNPERLIICGSSIAWEETPTIFSDVSQDLQKSLFKLGRSPRLTALCFRYLSIPASQLAQFPNLHTVILERCFVSSTASASYPLDESAFDGVRILHLIRCPNFFPLDYARSSGNSQSSKRLLGSLKSLLCDFDYPSGLDSTELHPVGRFLARLGEQTSIENLELASSPVSQLLGIDLSVSESIKHLTVRTSFADPPESLFYDLMLPWQIMLLPKTLESLRYVIDVPLLPKTRRIGEKAWPMLIVLREGGKWNDLDITLADAAQFPSLRRADFVLTFRVREEDRVEADVAVNEFAVQVRDCFALLGSRPWFSLNVDVELAVMPAVEGAEEQVEGSFEKWEARRGRDCIVM